MVDRSLIIAQGPELPANLNTSPNGKAVRAIARADSTRPVSFITESEVYKLADAARAMRDGDRNELLIITMFQACLRVTEAMQLKVKDKARLGTRHVLMVLGKGHKPRIVAIPESLAYRLGNYAQEYGLAADDRFFPISRVRAWQIVKECAAKAGLDRRVYCHLLRHAGAVVRLKKTGNPQSLQLHLGHADMKMTMRYLATTQLIDSLETEAKVQFDR